MEPTCIKLKVNLVASPMNEHLPNSSNMAQDIQFYLTPTKLLQFDLFENSLMLRNVYFIVISLQ